MDKIGIGKDPVKNKNGTQNKEINKSSEIVSPIPEWNENIQKIVVGYH